MSRAVKGSRKVDTELQKLSKYMVDVVREKKQQLDMDTCMILLNACGTVVKILSSMLKTRVAQIKSGHNTAEKKLKKKLKK